ncbi:MAG TPA: dienelactone hydrolase family protein [Xanthobacteraceae bacterium]
MTMLRVVPAALAAVIAFAAGPAAAEMKTEWVDYSQGNTKLKAYMAHDDKVTGKRPAIFVIHDREGMTDHTKHLVEMWSNLGYVAFAADIFGVVPKNLDEVLAQTKMFRADRALLRARTQAGFDTLLKNPMVDASKIALIGYCFGGAVGAEFGSMGAPLAANVAIHGSFGSYEPGWAKNIKGMYLILHGADDKNYPLTTVSKVIDGLRDAKVPFELEVYSGTGHGFSQPKNKDEERANRESIATTTRTLKELFGT